MTEPIYLSRSVTTEVEEQLVLEAMRSKWVAPLGPMVERFESEIAQRCGVAHALALSSGTAALHLALLGVGVGPGDVVIVPSLTFAATANAVVYIGAEPVFVDSTAGDGNLDVALTLNAIDVLRSEGRRVAAVLSVDLLGRCADYTTLVPGLEARGIPLVEDAAEALGASHAGQPAGSFGVAAGLSFNGNKILTTSGGGMLLSDDAEFIARAGYLSKQARQPVAWYEHTDIGYNYRLSNILAAIGVGQLSRFDNMLGRRREIREQYAVAVADLAGVEVLSRQQGMSDAEDNCWLTSLLVDERVAGIEAVELIGALNAAEIEARHVWKPMHLQPVFAHARMFSTGVADRIFAQGLSLPSGAELSSAQVDRVISTLRDAFNR